MKFGIRDQLTNVITCVKFWSIGSGVTEFWHPKIVPFPIDLLCRPYNSVHTLPCDPVMMMMMMT